MTREDLSARFTRRMGIGIAVSSLDGTYARRPTVHIDRLRMRNVRCFADTDVLLDAAVTVLVGENGAGKTTIAEAIASL